LIFRDFKDFNMNGSTVGVGQLELVSLELVADMKADIQAELERVKAEGRHTAMFLLTDIMQEGSELMMASDDAAKIAQAFGQDPAKLADGNLWLPGVMSRKKQVVPALEAAFRG
jgi:manganese-dependent inorganic pyrophosphatase